MDKIDVEKLSDEEIEELQKEIGKKIGGLFNSLREECRQYLEPFGIDIKISYLMFPKGTDLSQILNMTEDKAKDEADAEIK